MHHVFVTGGTGYIGRRVIAALVARGHRVRALARPGSETRLPPGCTPFVGDALDAASFQEAVAPADTFIHLVGVAHPTRRRWRRFTAWIWRRRARRCRPRGWPARSGTSSTSRWRSRHR